MRQYANARIADRPSGPRRAHQSRCARPRTATDRPVRPRESVHCRLGEDIVLTWTMMNSRGIVQYEPAALGFTVVPERLRGSHDPALTVGARSALGEHRSWALTTGGWDPRSISSLCPTDFCVEVTRHEVSVISR
jgi:hypothetical protein